MAGHAIAAAVGADRRHGALAPDPPHTAGETGDSKPTVTRNKTNHQTIALP